jgi:hypothetical protein
LNKFVPYPFFREKEEVVPRSPLVGADNVRRLPPDLDALLLSLPQKEQLVTIYRNYTSASKFLFLQALQARAAELGVGPLCDASVSKLKELCTSLGLQTTRANKNTRAGPELYGRVHAHVTRYIDIEILLLGKLRLTNGGDLTGARAIVSRIWRFSRNQEEFVVRVMYLSEQLADAPTSFDSEIKVSVLAAAAANVHLANQTHNARSQGNYYEAAHEGDVVHIYDHDHLAHNLTASIIKQSLDQEGEGLTSKESVLPRFRLLEAARKTGDQILVSCLENNYDVMGNRHLHAQSYTM